MSCYAGTKPGPVWGSKDVMGYAPGVPCMSRDERVECLKNAPFSLWDEGTQTCSTVGVYNHDVPNIFNYPYSPTCGH